METDVSRCGLAWMMLKWAAPVEGDVEKEVAPCGLYF
jgi:hypothetical protein